MSRDPTRGAAHAPEARQPEAVGAGASRVPARGPGPAAASDAYSACGSAAGPTARVCLAGGVGASEEEGWEDYVGRGAW